MPLAGDDDGDIALAWELVPDTISARGSHLANCQS